ncbi:hypothetical protein [Streptomyces sp. NPDC048825]|uniref:hypothetical protein n=1 Tax=Streptomyces sp. NPDC048825 TaxID=3365592 RepID=UPI003724382E
MPEYRPAADALVGVWQRALLVRPDGTRDAETNVTWVQGSSLYGDLRQPPGYPRHRGVLGLHHLGQDHLLSLAAQEAFAGELQYGDGLFTWHREIDFQPPGPFPDVGSLNTADGALVDRASPHPADGVIVEEGRYVAYREHWQAEERDRTDTAAARLHGRLDGLAGILVRVGSWFLYARDRREPLTGTESLADRVLGAASLARARELLDCEVSLGRVADGRWQVLRSTLPHREGRPFPMLPTTDGKDCLCVQDVDAGGTVVPLVWEIAACEGPGSLLAARGPC